MKQRAIDNDVHTALVTEKLDGTCVYVAKFEGRLYPVIYTLKKVVVFSLIDISFHSVVCFFLTIFLSVCMNLSQHEKQDHELKILQIKKLVCKTCIVCVYSSVTTTVRANHFWLWHTFLFSHLPAKLCPFTSATKQVDNALCQESTNTNWKKPYSCIYAKASVNYLKQV